MGPGDPDGETKRETEWAGSLTGGGVLQDPSDLIYGVSPHVGLASEDGPSSTGPGKIPQRVEEPRVRTGECFRIFARYFPLTAVRIGDVGRPAALRDDHRRSGGKTIEKLPRGVCGEHGPIGKRNDREAGGTKQG